MSVAEYRQLNLFRSKRQKGTRPPAAPEFRTQCALADHLRYSANPEWFWTAFPSGELRTKETGARLKRMGLRPGVSDFILISPEGRFYGLEIKRVRGGRLSISQEAFQDWCQRHGVAYEVAEGFDAAVSILKAWGVLP